MTGTRWSKQCQTVPSLTYGQKYREQFTGSSKSPDFGHFISLNGIRPNSIFRLINTTELFIFLNFWLLAAAAQKFSDCPEKPFCPTQVGAADP